MRIWHYALLVFLSGCSYGVVSTFVKLGYSEGFLQSEITGSQYLFSVTMLWMIAFFVPKIRLSGKQWLILLISGIPMGLTTAFYNEALNYINASFAIILLLQFTWMSIVLEYIFYKVVPNRKSLIATAIILFGSVLASGFLKSSITFSLVGITWGLLSALSFAAFIFVSGRTSIPVHPIYKSAIMATGAALLVWIILPPSFLINGALADGLTMYSLPAGLFGSLIPAVFLNIGVPKVGNGLGTILSASELPMAVFMSSLVLHETVIFSQWIGVTIILAGIAYPNLQIRQTAYLIRKKQDRAST